MVRVLRRLRSSAHAVHAAGRGPATTLCWADAHATPRECASFMYSGPSGAAQAQRRLVSQLGRTDISEELGSRLAVWAHAREMQAFASLGIQEGPEACSYHGRAQALDFVPKP